MKECREQNGMSQKYVAIELKIAPAQISKWESGVTAPSIEHLIDLSRLYHVTVDYLIGNKEPDASESKEIVSLYSAMNDHGRQKLIEYAQLLLLREENKSISSSSVKGA